MFRRLGGHLGSQDPASFWLSHEARDAATKDLAKRHLLLWPDPRFAEYGLGIPQRGDSCPARLP